MGWEPHLQIHSVHQHTDYLHLHLQLASPSKPSATADRQAPPLRTPGSDIHLLRGHCSSL